METGVRIRSGFMSALLSVSVADYFPINLKVDVVFDFSVIGISLWFQLLNIAISNSMSINRVTLRAMEKAASIKII